MKKKHFWSGRIRKLSACMAIVVLLLVGAGISVSAQSKNEDPTPMSTKAIGITGALSIAFTPLALVKNFKAKGKWDNLDEDTQRFVSELDEQLTKAFDEVQKGILSESDIEKKHGEWMKKYGTGLDEAQMKQFEEMNESLINMAKELEKVKDRGVAAQLAKNIVAQLKERESEVKDFRERKKGVLKFEIDSPMLAFKAGGADQAPTDIATHTIGMRVPGIGQLPVRRPLVRDLFTTVPCSLEYIKYIDQETVVRDAQNVATAAASTHTSKLTWKERSIQITNVRDLIDVPINMLEDYDFVQGELERLLNVNVSLKIDNGLLLDDGIYPNLHSIDEFASEFDATNTLGGTIEPWNNTVDTPNIFDLVIAMSSHIIALGQDGKFMPNAVLFNTIDRYKSLLIKDADGQYLMPPFVVRTGNKEYNIDGMIVRSNPNVPAGSLYVFDSTKGTVYQRKTAIAEISYENATNFETEVATLKVYERLNMLVRNTDANAFMKCSDIEAALLALKAA